MLAASPKVDFYALGSSCEVHMGTGIKDDVLNAFCWMYSTFNIPSDYKGSCAKKVQDPTALYNTYYQARLFYRVQKAVCSNLL